MDAKIVRKWLKIKFLKNSKNLKIQNFSSDAPLTHPLTASSDALSGWCAFFS